MNRSKMLVAASCVFIALTASEKKSHTVELFTAIDRNNVSEVEKLLTLDCVDANAVLGRDCALTPLWQSTKKIQDYTLAYDQIPSVKDDLAMLGVSAFIGWGPDSFGVNSYKSADNVVGYGHVSYHVVKGGHFDFKEHVKIFVIARNLVAGALAIKPAINLCANAYQTLKVDNAICKQAVIMRMLLNSKKIRFDQENQAAVGTKLFDLTQVLKTQSSKKTVQDLNLTFAQAFEEFETKHGKINPLDGSMMPTPTIYPEVQPCASAPE